MTADLLRRAAAQMRERAQTATPSPWQADGPFWWSESESTGLVTAGTDRRAVAVLPQPHINLGQRNDPDVGHIASWHPDVALAVARWLEVVALHWDDGSMCCDNGPDECDIVEPAQALARVYLGDPA